MKIDHAVRWCNGFLLTIVGVCVGSFALAVCRCVYFYPIPTLIGLAILVLPWVVGLLGEMAGIV
jgi:hypothetical protein